MSNIATNDDILAVLSLFLDGDDGSETDFDLDLSMSHTSDLDSLTSPYLLLPNESASGATASQTGHFNHPELSRLDRKLGPKMRELILALLTLQVALNSADFRKIDEIFSRYFDEKIHIDGFDGPVEGRESVKSHFVQMLVTMPDVVLTISNITTRDGRITLKCHIRGTKVAFDGQPVNLCSAHILPSALQDTDTAAGSTHFELQVVSLLTFTPDTKKSKFTGLTFCELSRHAVEYSV